MGIGIRGAVMVKGLKMILSPAATTVPAGECRVNPENGAIHVLDPERIHRRLDFCDHMARYPGGDVSHP